MSTIKDLNSVMKKYFARPNGIVLSSHITISMGEIRLQENEYPISYLSLKADEDNSGEVYIGVSGVSISAFPLLAGDSLSIEINDLSQVYFNSSAVGQTLHCLATY